MKNRGLVVALGIIVALAVVATVVVVHKANQAKPAAPAARTVAVRPAHPTAPVRKLASAPAAPAAPEAPAPTELIQPVVAETPSLDPLASAFADPAAFVAALSDRELRDLMDILLQKQVAKARQEERYHTKSDLLLSFIQRNTYGPRKDLGLTPAQQAQIAKLKEAIRPQMETLLADVWAKQEEVAKKLEVARKGVWTAEEYQKFTQDNQALLQQEKDLFKQADDLAQPLDNQYAAAVRSILTPDQQQQFDNVLVQRLPNGTSMTLKSSVDANGQPTGGMTIFTGR